MPSYRRYPYGTSGKRNMKKRKTANIFNTPDKARTKVHDISIICKKYSVHHLGFGLFLAFFCLLGRCLKNNVEGDEKLNLVLKIFFQQLHITSLNSIYSWVTFLPKSFHYVIKDV